MRVCGVEVDSTVYAESVCICINFLEYSVFGAICVPFEWHSCASWQAAFPFPLFPAPLQASRRHSRRLLAWRLFVPNRLFLRSSLRHQFSRLPAWSHCLWIRS